MEFNNHQESEKQNDDDYSGIGRSYECVYCKRGFNTAQALGGHMNIHRRDKAKNKRNYYSDDRLEEEQNHHRLSRSCYYNQNQPAASYNYHHHHDQLVYDHHHQPISSSYLIGRFPDHQRRMIENPNLVADEGWNMMSPRLDYGSVILGEKNREKEELDLELRLGS